jgi:hypothetical protein
VSSSLLQPAEVTTRRAASLAPTREWAYDTDALVAELIRATDDDRRIDATTYALTRLEDALARSFPDNIFCDLDYLSRCLWSAGSPTQIEQLGERLVALMRGFGCESPIRFRYAHDFLYGFDWARWVRKDPPARAHVGPFDAQFVHYLERRQREILTLVRGGDEAFGVIEPGAYRNPFCFARTPREERVLHTKLAERDLIPVRAWRSDGKRSWQKPYTELRAELAESLGFTKLPAR